MRRAVIHIGANKAASTTLQRALFRHHTGLHYLGEDGTGYENYRDVVNAMVSDDDLHFPADACEKLFTSHVEQAAGKTLLYSNEDLMTSRMPILCAQRLRKFLPDSEIILITRNQFTAIPSFYASHGAFLKPAPPSYFRRHVGFDDWMNYQILFIKYGALASFFYNKVLKIYSDLFGLEHTHVFLFEEFIGEKGKFTKKLCRVLQIDYEEATMLLGEHHERRSITRRRLAYNRFRTVFFWGVPLSRYIPGGKVIAPLFQRFLESGPSAKINLKRKWRQKIHDLYAEDNAALAATYDLPLKEYGYPVV